MEDKTKGIPEKELEEFIGDELKKDLTQDDKIDESVEQHLGEMGFLWDRVQKKLYEDKTCYGCKKIVNTEEETHVAEATVVEKGVVAFVSICSDCYNKQQKKGEKNEKSKKNNST